MTNKYQIPSKSQLPKSKKDKIKQHEGVKLVVLGFGF